ncbi:unnamed protein product, partial [marine sediment metagenome]
IERRPAPSHKNLDCPNCIDWAMPIGTPILAARDGKVEETESRFNTHGGQEFVNKTNYIVIEHDNNESSVYVHLKYRGLEVKTGQQLKAGQIIGYSGQTGFAGYPHLHFGVYKKVDRKRGIPSGVRSRIKNGELVNVKVELKRR